KLQACPSACNFLSVELSHPRCYDPVFNAMDDKPTQDLATRAFQKRVLDEFGAVRAEQAATRAELADMRIDAADLRVQQTAMAKNIAAIDQRLITVEQRLTTLEDR